MRENPTTGSFSEPNDADWPVPTPPGLGLPSSRAYVSRPETVLDEVTGLEWQAAVPDATFTWQEASDYCDELSLGALSDFRLPSRVELVSLLSLDVAEPAIDSAVFPGTPGEWFWSASALAEDPASAWYAYFYFGYPDVDARESAFRVRCVTSPRAAPPTGPRYEVAGESVRDRRTGLTFQRAPAASPMTHAAATAYCDALVLAGATDWRLPTMQELETLVDERVRGPAIDDAAFPETPPVAFWSSSGWAGSAELAWYVSFDYGAALYDLRSTQNAVRCVH